MWRHLPGEAAKKLIHPWTSTCRPASSEQTSCAAPYNTLRINTTQHNTTVRQRALGNAFPNETTREFHISKICYAFVLLYLYTVCICICIVYKVHTISLNLIKSNYIIYITYTIYITYILRCAHSHITSPILQE